MIYTIDDLKFNIGIIADKYDIEEILLFGSYFDHAPNEDSDVDLLVKYGTSCKGLNRIKFMNELEEQLQKLKDTKPEPVDYQEKVYNFSQAINALKDDNVSAREKNNLLKVIIKDILYYRIDDDTFGLDIILH